MPMTEKKKVVLFLEDGSQLKGMAESFDPAVDDTIALTLLDDRGSFGETREVAVDRVRAAFFVHDLAPFRRYRLPDRAGPPEAELHPLNGEVRARIELEWGQRLHGLLRSHDVGGCWYDYVPLGSDRAGNLIHALIAAGAIVEAEPVACD